MCVAKQMSVRLPLLLSLVLVFSASLSHSLPLYFTMRVVRENVLIPYSGGEQRQHATSYGVII